MTTAKQIEEQALGWFVRLQDLDAPESAWLDFQSWLEADPAHSRAFDGIEQAWVEIEQPAQVLPVANDDIPLVGGRRRSGPAWLYPSFAAAAAAVVALGVWTQSNVGTGQTYSTDDAARTVVLSDGSTLYLNRHTDLSVRMERDRRSVTLRDGEAAFDVAHNAARPFEITAGDHDVRVLGTAFNVVHHDGRFAVSVERGVVAVRPARAKSDLRLVAGQRIDQAGTGLAVLSKVASDEASAWRRGVLIYHDAGLTEVGDDLSRYFDKPVIVSSSAQKLRFTGALQVGDEATMLDQLQDFVPIRSARSATDVRLTAREGR